MNIKDFCGNYAGSGNWYQEDGRNNSYEIKQSIRAHNNELVLCTQHQHADGNHFELEFRFLPITPPIYRVNAGGKDVGRGFLLNDILQFHWSNKYFIPDLDSVTAVCYRLVSPVQIECHGSSTKNSAGNYIMWHESLRRTEA